MKDVIVVVEFLDNFLVKRELIQRMMSLMDPLLSTTSAKAWDCRVFFEATLEAPKRGERVEELLGYHQAVVSVMPDQVLSCDV